MNNKFWQHSVFDLKTGQELSYVDNTGKQYAFDPDGQLLYYNDLSQELLDNLPTVSTDEKEQLFLDKFKGLTMKTDWVKYPNKIFFKKNSVDNQVIMEYDLKNGCFYIHYRKIWSFFETKFHWNNEQIQDFMKSRLEDYLNLANTTPYLCYQFQIS